MFYMIHQTLGTVPAWAWLAFCAYCVLQVALYWWGLPFHGQKKFAGIKSVSHGVDTCVHYEKVYDAVYTAANAITILGLAGVGVTAYLVATDTFLPLVPCLFAAAVGLSDILDGAAAMRHDEHSLVGAAIDPLRDRLAIILIAVAILQVVGIDWWLLAAIPMAGFEAWIITMGMSARKNETALNTHGSGKYRQMAHLAVIGMLLTAFYLGGDLGIESGRLLTVVGLLIMGLASGLAALEYLRQSRG